MPAIAPDPNRGPRSSWRCTGRDQDGHRCRFRAEHAGVCSAFGREFSGRPKALRRKAAKIRKEASS